MTTVTDLYAQLDLFSMADKQVAPPSNGTPTSALAALQAILLLDFWTRHEVAR